MPATITAKIVIASAVRLMPVLHFCRNKNKIAEIRVPAWPMPIQNTKLMMNEPQPIGWLMPRSPVPIPTTPAMPTRNSENSAPEMANAIHHRRVG